MIRENKSVPFFFCPLFLLFFFYTVPPRRGRSGFKNDDQRVFQVNRPDKSVFFGLLPKTDSVSDLPVFLGGNSQYSDDPVKRALGALFTVTSLLDEDSPHSNYSCINCPAETPSNVNTKIRDIVIKPTLIDSQGNTTRLP